MKEWLKIIGLSLLYFLGLVASVLLIMFVMFFLFDHLPFAAYFVYVPMLLFVIMLCGFAAYAKVKGG